MFLAPKVEEKEEGSIYKDIEWKDDTEILEKKVVEAESKDNIMKVLIQQNSPSAAKK